MWRCQFFPTWSIDSVQSQSEFQQVILWISTNWFLKFVWRDKRSRISNTVLREKNKAGGLILPNFKTYQYCKATVIQTALYWWNRQIDQKNRIESPEIDPHKYSQVIFDKEAKATNGEKIVSSIYGAERTGHPHVKTESRHRPYTVHKS